MLASSGRSRTPLGVRSSRTSVPASWPLVRSPPGSRSAGRRFLGTSRCLRGRDWFASGGRRTTSTTPWSRSGWPCAWGTSSPPSAQSRWCFGIDGRTAQRRGRSHEEAAHDGRDDRSTAAHQLQGRPRCPGSPPAGAVRAASGAGGRTGGDMPHSAPRASSSRGPGGPRGDDGKRRSPDRRRVG